MIRTMEKIEDLADFDDGRVAVAFKRLLERIAYDLDDRPALAKERTVTLKVRFTPVPNETGGLGDVKMEVECGASVPSMRTREITGRRKEGEPSFRFNDLSPDNPAQRTIDQEMNGEENRIDEP